MSEPIPNFPRSKGRQSSQKNEANSGIPEPPETGLYVLASRDGVLEWLETEDCNAP